MLAGIGLFGLLDELKGSHHVQECSLTQCTLEQIFILMASKANMRVTDPSAIVVNQKMGKPLGQPVVRTPMSGVSGVHIPSVV
jgi:hypothetical protein